MIPLAEHEAWVEYMRASVASNEAFLRWQEARGGDTDVAKECLTVSRQTLRESEVMLAEVRRMTSAQSAEGSAQ